MSKIVQAINSMIVNQDKISGVLEIPESAMLLFLYDGKYKWGIRCTDDDYILSFIQTERNLDQLDIEILNNVPTIYYRASELGTKEAFASFQELYQILKEKLLGIDEVLKDIIGEDVPF